MRVRASSVIKVDGVTRQDIDEITVCENQQPTIQLDLWGKPGSGEGGLHEVEKNARFDWYAGSAEEPIARVPRWRCSPRENSPRPCASICSA